MEQSEALLHAIKNSPAVVHGGRYAYLKLSAPPTSSAYFLLSQDADEITAVVEEDVVSQFSFAQSEGWFTLVEFRVNQPFQTVGFIAAVTEAVPLVGENVLVVSTFSKDYILVEEVGTEKVMEALAKRGFVLVPGKAAGS